MSKKITFNGKPLSTGWPKFNRFEKEKGKKYTKVDFDGTVRKIEWVKNTTNGNPQWAFIIEQNGEYYPALTPANAGISSRVSSSLDNQDCVFSGYVDSKDNLYITDFKTNAEAYKEDNKDGVEACGTVEACDSVEACGTVEGSCGVEADNKNNELEKFKIGGVIVTRDADGKSYSNDDVQAQKGKGTVTVFMNDDNKPRKWQITTDNKNGCWVFSEEGNKPVVVYDGEIKDDNNEEEWLSDILKSIDHLYTLEETYKNGKKPIESSVILSSKFDGSDPQVIGVNADGNLLIYVGMENTNDLDKLKVKTITVAPLSEDEILEKVTDYVDNHFDELAKRYDRNPKEDKMDNRDYLVDMIRSNIGEYDGVFIEDATNIRDTYTVEKALGNLYDDNPYGYEKLERYYAKDVNIDDVLLWETLSNKNSLSDLFKFRLVIDKDIMDVLKASTKPTEKEKEKL